MKIDTHKTPENPGQNRTTQNIQNTHAAAPNSGAVGAKKTGPGDQVDISSQSKEIADIMAAVSQLPDVREAKVAEIKKSVEAGTYSIDPNKIAEKILKDI